MLNKPYSSATMDAVATGTAFTVVILMVLVILGFRVGQKLIAPNNATLAIDVVGN